MGGVKQLNNSGFSLIELIVAVLITGIVAGGAIMSVSIISNARADRAANVSSSMMKRARQKALTMDDASHSLYVEFSVDSGNYFGKVYFGNATSGMSELASEKIGNDKLTLTFKNHSGSDSAAVSDSTKVRVYFKKKTGGIEKITKVASGAETVIANADQLVVSGSETITVILGNVTGRCYVDSTT